MKKIILTAIAAIAAMGMNAQGFNFGLRGGLNLTTESENKSVGELSDNKFKAGPHIGGVLNYAFNNRFELESDLLYSMQGYNDKIYYIDSEQIVAPRDHHITSHYLTLPIAAKVNIVKGAYIECGPQFGYLLSKKDKLEGVETENAFPSESTKKFDFGLLGGVGYRFKNGLFVNARYIHGFTGTSKLYDGGNNRTIQISLGNLF